jgi:ribosomal protein L11 methyltransferase
MAIAKTTFLSSPEARAAWESALDARLTEDGFVIASCEISRDGPWRIDVFGEGDPAEVAAAIADGARELGVAAPASKVETLPDTDWVAENQRSFRPFSVGPFWVHPSHASDGMPPGALPLRIDAGLAFGTGTHATTRGCLELLATLDASETVNAIDVGCGSGILAIAMAKLWRRQILGSDNDPEAIGVARENAALNGVDDLCSFVEAAGLDTPAIAARAPFDLIVANILAGPLVELAPRFAGASRRILLSGLLVEQAAEVLDAYGRLGFDVERRIDLETGGAWWRSLLLRRY